MSASNRHLSRTGNRPKRLARPSLEEAISQEARRLILAHYPSTRKPAVEVAARLAGLVASLIAVQTQAVQRSLKFVDARLQSMSHAFVDQVTLQAAAEVGIPDLHRPLEVHRPTANSVVGAEIAVDWAGPTAGPTALERHFGIPRSTLFRWQKRSEVIALRTGGKRYVFPIKQFVDGRPVKGLSSVCEVFGSHRMAWRWLITPSLRFSGESPIDILLAEKLEAVLVAAEASIHESDDPPVPGSS